MARKTVKEKIADVKVNPHYSITLEEASELLKLQTEPFDLIMATFQYGYLQGGKATKKELGRVRA